LISLGELEKKIYVFKGERGIVKSVDGVHGSNERCVKK